MDAVTFTAQPASSPGAMAPPTAGAGLSLETAARWPGGTVTSTPSRCSFTTPSMQVATSSVLPGTSVMPSSEPLTLALPEGVITSKLPPLSATYTSPSVSSMRVCAWAGSVPNSLIEKTLPAENTICEPPSSCTSRLRPARTSPESFTSSAPPMSTTSGGSAVAVGTAMVATGGCARAVASACTSAACVSAAPGGMAGAQAASRITAGSRASHTNRRVLKIWFIILFVICFTIKSIQPMPEKNNYRSRLRHQYPIGMHHHGN